MDPPHSVAEEINWPDLDNIEKPVLESDIVFDVAAVQQGVSKLEEFFNANDMSFPLFEDAQSSTPAYKLLLPSQNAEDMDSYESLVIGLEQNRLVAKAQQGDDEFKDLIKMLLA